MPRYHMFGAPSAAPVLTSPKVDYLFQRNGSSQGTIPITGSMPIAFTSIEARVISGISGTSTDWATATTNGSGTAGTFSGSLTGIAPGDYQLQVRSKSGSRPNGIASVSGISVGEIIIPCGQSLFANSNQTIQTARDPRSKTINLAGVVSPCADPMPIASDVQGSIWTIVADLLVAQLHMPVLIATCSVGGSAIADWQPGASAGYYNNYLKPTLALFTAARCVLFGQGEADATAGTSAANYSGTAGVNGLRNVISNSRTDFGSAIPWGINLESSADGISTNSTIRGAQTTVIGDSGNFQLIDVDSYLGANRWGASMPHLSTLGQTNIGQAIAARLISFFGW